MLWNKASASLSHRGLRWLSEVEALSIRSQHNFYRGFYEMYPNRIEPQAGQESVWDYPRPAILLSPPKNDHSFHDRINSLTTSGLSS